MTYYGIRNKQTGELLRQFFRKNAEKGNMSVISLDNIGDPLSVHIFLTKNKKTELERRLKKPSKKISHSEVLKKFA